MVWAMLGFVGEDWVLGLRRDLESIDGPAQVEVVMDLETAAVCRSRAGRTEDAIFAQAVRRVTVTVGGRMQCWLDGFASTARARSRYESESGVWRMSLPSSRGEADLVLSVPEVPKYFLQSAALPLVQRHRASIPRCGGLHRSHRRTDHLALRVASHMNSYQICHTLD